MTLTKLIDRILVFLISALVLFFPFFFLPLTTEYYEFNKLALLAGALFLSWSLYSLKIFEAKKLVFVRTKLDLPIFLLLLVYVFSTIFSLSPATSFLGSHGLFHPSLLSFFLCVSFYYLVVQVVANDRQGSWNPQSLILLTLFISSFLLALLALLQYFEIYLFPWDFTHQRFWTPIGGIKTLIFYLLPISPLLISRIKKQPFFLLPLLTILLALFLVSNWGGPLRKTLPADLRRLPFAVTLDWQTSWQIANSVLGTRPIFGSGPGTFFSDFTRFKPLSLNQTSVWNIRFNRAGNYWFEVLATLGLAGVAVLVYFWSKIIKLSTPTCLAPEAVSLSLVLLSTFFAPQTIATSFLFFLLLALFVHRQKATEKLLLRGTVEPLSGRGPKREVAFYLFFSTFCFLFSLFSFYFYFFRLFLAEVQYQKATRQFTQDPQQSYQTALLSAKLNPLVDVYQIGLSTASLGVASQMSRQASPSAQAIRQFSNQAVASARRAVQLDSWDVRNWENLAGVYQNLLSADPNAVTEVVSSLQQAINLDPANPLLRHQLGRFFFRQNQPSEAVNYYLSALNLKPDFLQAHYDLAQTYKVLGNINQAKQELQTILSLLSSDSSQREIVESELQALEVQPASPSGGIRR